MSFLKVELLCLASPFLMHVVGVLELLLQVVTTMKTIFTPKKTANPLLLCFVADISTFFVLMYDAWLRVKRPLPKGM